MKQFSPAYAIVRIDRDVTDDEQRVTVRRIVWELDLADEEVRRLNELNADKGCVYFWQYTRVDPGQPLVGAN